LFFVFVFFHCCPNDDARIYAKPHNYSSMRVPMICSMANGETGAADDSSADALTSAGPLEDQCRQLRVQVNALREIVKEHDKMSKSPVGARTWARSQCVVFANFRCQH
jgi:hypothetical protein